MTRAQKTLFVLVAIVLLGLGLIWQRTLSGSDERSAFVEAGIILLPQSRALPDLTLVDQDGQPMPLSRLKGKWTLVFFGYTFCPDICPTTLAQLRQIQGELPAKTVERLRVVLVSVDPNRDTPQQLKQYLGYFDKRFMGLSAPLGDIGTLANALSIPFVPPDTSKPNYIVQHSGNLALIGPDGRQRGFIRAPLDSRKLVGQLPEVVEND